uniref:Uncharacterized protein n=1 Tax=Arundo donax TaxID=35708 RepID=A0A0A8ZNQ6_ARUDO
MLLNPSNLHESLIFAGQLLFCESSKSRKYRRYTVLLAFSPETICFHLS